MRLGNLQPQLGSRTSVKRVGRGIGSGTGKTSTKGHKGQWARSGGGVRPGFEGGQMPLTRRSPKRGFNNNFRKVYATVNVGMLNGFEANSVVDYDVLYGEGLIKETKNAIGLKVLGDGELKVALTVKAKAFSASAKEAIEKAGGTVEIL
ncbi:MAG TPA: 50S ribosomal protein L15 [Clostridiales bacterium]|nr:50S ribosomal protein L15 [Clostridiales bacterium]